MRSEYFKIASSSLGHEFEFKTYGENGKPVMVFPCSCGRFYEYEDFGMVETLRRFIEAGDIFLVAVDSRDSLSWHNPGKGPWMGDWHRKWELCVAEEVAPFIRSRFRTEKPFLATGNSWGAAHALNFALKFPGVFDSSISLSGVYSHRHVIGDYYDDSVYFNDALMYLPGLPPEGLRGSYIILCHGRGAWEIANEEARRIAGLLQSKGIPHWYDVWDEGYPHEWFSWRAQIVKFMDALKAGVLYPCAGGVRKFLG
ncbi:MAG: alpha/beta hydrolase-fold protein [Elusimicrobiota bacterium]